MEAQLVATRKKNQRKADGFNHNAAYQAAELQEATCHPVISPETFFRIARIAPSSWRVQIVLVGREVHSTFRRFGA